LIACKVLLSCQLSLQNRLTVTAKSNADPTQTATATVTLLPVVTVTVLPSTVTLLPSSPPQQFTATVTGSGNTGVTWSLSPQVGSISAAGSYTAPSSVASQQTVTVTAKSNADPTKTGTAAITLLPLATQTLATFQLNELFSASWSDQPIEFRYDGGKPAATTRMIGPNGTEVPFQWVSSCSDTAAVNGCILVRGNLPAGATYTWTLQSGASASAVPANPVQLVQAGSNWELTNGLTGIRLVAAGANPNKMVPFEGLNHSPWEFALNQLRPKHPEDVEIIKAMLKAGADPNAASGEAANHQQLRSTSALSFAYVRPS
jgi:hypothetical protein